VVRALVDRFRDGGMTLARGGRPLTEPHEVRAFVAQTLDQQLPQLVRCSLLVA
jgi:hypothetical protein